MSFHRTKMTALHVLISSPAAAQRPNSSRERQAPGHSRLRFLLSCALVVLIISCSGAQPSSSRSSKCKDISVEESVRQASVVVSGTVKKLWNQEVHLRKVIRAELEVKRIFKGEDIVKSVSSTQPGVLRSHRIVTVQGFGDPDICDNTVREKDTKIFILNLNQVGELRLSGDIISLTLRNLDYVDSVVNNLPFVTEKTTDISPCFLYFCPYGATCQVNETSYLPRCVCEQVCGRVFAPVCGSDGVTYTNLCMLEKASCVRNRKIKVAREGSCGVRNPCEGQVCKFGAECMPSMDGTIARCQCPSDCPSYGDSLDSKPVCGNDGNDYANLCQLRKAACEKLEDIRVKYYGKCDPCEGFTCEPPKVCQVNAQREPECRCSYICPTEMNLVCGTDGRTYSNQCLLRKQACKSRKDIRVLYNGKCSPDNNPCHQVQCGPEEECSVDRTGKAVCVCPPACEPVLRRVCGNDSTTYDNECELRRRSCLEKIFVTIKHPGPCGSSSVCEGYFCDYGAVCVEHNGVPVCQCPQCTEEYKPVCGENGITYENECKLRHENCQREENVKVKKQGSCDGCGQQRCEFYAVCESLGGRPRCICPTSCVKVHAPVCGNDGVTYANECELRVESCHKKKFLTIASTGSCDTCKGVTCEFNAKCESGICICPIVCQAIHEPVCGSDDQTYPNECEMRKYSCSQRLSIEVARTGECEEPFSGSGDTCGDGDIVEDVDAEQELKLTMKDDRSECTHDSCLKFGGICELVGVRYKCSCSFSCGAVRQRVCGSDSQIYGNKCTMEWHSCTKRKLITEQPMENCDEFDEQEVCDGSAPLINPGTGSDYNCGPGGDPCPPNSYCDLTLQSAKCCREESAVVTNCSETIFGCCGDGKTPARGPRESGCPEVCSCNLIGSYSSTCDPRTRQCTCKPGVGGKRCDRCDIGYWGLHMIAEAGNAGCIPCSCNKYGSHRDDCDQMTGRCMCKPHIMGMKCDMCRNRNVPGPEGCRDQFPPDSCDDLICGHGATCQEEEHGKPICVCEHTCDAKSLASENVCGTDGQNYGSKCQLELFGCRMQKDISVAYAGSCKGASPLPVTTSSPVTKSRKTTRDIDVSEDSFTDMTDKGERIIEEPQEKKCTGSMIDDLCLTNNDCCPDFSHCRSGLCYCYEGYAPTSDNSQCFEVKPAQPEKSDNTSHACTKKPCLFGQCVLDDLLGFRCACPLGKAGSRCERNIDFAVPSFSGRSHLELKRIEKASQDLSIDIIFSTANKDGIILFNSKFKNGSGDFVSLSVKDGFIEFRYDLGAGPAILRSRKQVEMPRSHRVVAHRVKEAGTLIVDGDEPVTGSALATHTSLNLEDPLLVGYIPHGTKEIYERVGVDMGLVGCVHSLKAGSRDDMYSYNLALFAEYTDVVKGTDVTECGNNPCKSLPCQNGGTCLVLDAQIYECRCKTGFRGILCQELISPCASNPCQYGGTCISMASPNGYFCQCTHGREGVQCETESIQEVFVPQFTGDSYIELPLGEKMSSSLSITVWFMSTKPDGVLFFITQNPGGQGDFVALNLQQKRLIFTFFLGSGLGRIESKKHIHQDKWHKVTVRRNGRMGDMTIDDHTPITGEASGSSTALNIDNRSLFLGGFRYKEDVPPKAGIQSGFSGAIQRIIINGRTIEGLMSSAVTMRNISTYNGPPCNTNPCLNGGVCVPMLNEADCRCPATFMGEKCEKRYEEKDKDQPVKFDGTTYLSYPNEASHKQEGQQSNKFVIRFKTSQSDGILLLQTAGDTTASDYLSVAVLAGHVELSYNLGKQSPDKLFVIRSGVTVTDNMWHTAKIHRKHQQGSLQVDNEDPIVNTSEQGTQQLDTDGLLWVGGRSNLLWGLPTTKNFDGCINYVEVNGQPLNLIRDQIGHGTSVTFCS